MDREHILQALNDWAALTGADQLEGKKKINLGQWALQQDVETLNEATELDPTGDTTIFAIKALHECFRKKRTFTLAEIEAGRHVRDGQLSAKLWDLWHSPEFAEMDNQFREGVIDGLRRLKAPKAIDYVQEQPIEDLVRLRLAALRSHKSLRRDRFREGVVSGVSARLNPHVYEFYTLTDLLEATLAHAEPGITLAVMRDEDPVHSFFVVVVWDGANLTTLTDREDWEHPQQKVMCRRPDRILADRWNRHYFPYPLLDLQVTEKTISARKRKGVVLRKVPGKRLVPWSKLPHEELIWWRLLVELLDGEYFKQPLVALPRSAVGLSPEEENSANLPALRGDWRVPLVVPAVKELGALTATQWVRTPVGLHTWLEERYQDQISQHDLLPKLTLPKPDDAWWKPQRRGDRELLDPRKETTFGTETEIKRDAEWVLRHNQAVLVQRLAEKEFDERKDEVVAWFKARVQANRAALIRAAASGELLSVGKIANAKAETFWHPSDEEPEFIEQPRNLVHMAWGRKYWEYATTAAIHGGVRNARLGKVSCAVKPVLASVKVNIKPCAGPDLAILLACRLEDLPDVLQHYDTTDPYTGNCILDRLDPMEWVVDDPWKKLGLSVVVHFSRSGMNACRAAQGLPRYDFSVHDKNH